MWQLGGQAAEPSVPVRMRSYAVQPALQKLNTMNDTDIIAAAARRISADVEKITRRNMKECVAEHIQSLCKKDGSCLVETACIGADAGAGAVAGGAGFLYGTGAVNVWQNISSRYVKKILPSPEKPCIPARL